MVLKILSVVGFLIMVVAILLAYGVDCLWGGNALAIIVQVLAVCLMIWARVTFGGRSFHAAGNTTQGELVTSGPYRLIRHPIYAAVLYFIWAGVLTHISVESILIGLIGIVGGVTRILIEEKFLRERYPDYVEYTHRTKRLIPFLV